MEEKGKGKRERKHRSYMSSSFCSIQLYILRTIYNQIIEKFHLDSRNKAKKNIRNSGNKLENIFRQFLYFFSHEFF